MIIAPPAGATVIDFDDFTAQCLFVDAPEPLTSRYSGLGVNFSGPAPGSGGIIVDECGSFGVAGHSSPNFLAFNTAAQLPAGGSPIGPETIEFTEPVSLVQVNVGYISSGTIALACFNGASAVGSSTLIGTSNLQTISVAGPGITRCVLSFTGDALVADDLAFVVGSPELTAVPSMNQWGLLVLVLMVAAFAMLRFPRGGIA